MLPALILGWRAAPQRDHRSDSLSRLTWLQPLHEVAQTVLTNRALVHREHRRCDRAFQPKLSAASLEIYVCELAVVLSPNVERPRVAGCELCEHRTRRQVTEVHLLERALETEVRHAGIEGESRIARDFDDAYGVIEIEVSSR